VHCLVVVNYVECDGCTQLFVVLENWNDHSQVASPICFVEALWILQVKIVNVVTCTIIYVQSGFVQSNGGGHFDFE
jgi:hypothetical protein